MISDRGGACQSAGGLEITVVDVGWRPGRQAQLTPHSELIPEVLGGNNLSVGNRSDHHPSYTNCASGGFYSQTRASVRSLDVHAECYAVVLDGQVIDVDADIGKGRMHAVKERLELVRSANGRARLAQTVDYTLRSEEFVD